MIDKNKRYLIAIDIDDTLRNSKKKITKKNIDTIKKVVNKGHIVVICSGRPKLHSLDVANKIGASSYIISHNGSGIYDLKRNKEIYFSKLNKKYLKELVTYCYNNNLKMVITIDGIDYVTKYTGLKHQVELDEKTYHKMIDENDISQGLIIDKDIKKIYLLREKVKLENRFSIANQSSMSKPADYYWFCINNKTTSKGKGLQILAGYLNIPMSDTIAIGNDDNDISMFQKAGYAVAVDNASENVKKHADFVTKSCSKSGVAEFLKKLI